MGSRSMSDRWEGAAGYRSSWLGYLIKVMASGGHLPPGGAAMYAEAITSCVQDAHTPPADHGSGTVGPNCSNGSPFVPLSGATALPQ